MRTTFGTVLKDMRAELGLSQADLAADIGTTQRHVSFLETGRSQPGRAMLGRLVSELKLSAGQRAALFESSGFRSPYKKREFGSDEVAAALDIIETHVLRHWPFPAFVLDPEWNVLRINTQGAAMFAPFTEAANSVPNLLDLFISPAFRAIVVNWEQASTSLYFRLQAAAGHSPAIATKLRNARNAGVFDHIADHIIMSDDIPIFVPIALQHPSGALLNITSMMGQLVSVHDALVEGFEIELMVPIDQPTEDCLLSTLPKNH